MALIKTIEEIKKYCSIVELNMAIESLESYLGKAEKYVKECLGDDTYTALVTNYNDDGDDADLQALLPYVQAPLVNIALYFWINGGQLQVSDKGVQVDHSGTTKTAFQWQVDAWREDLDRDGWDALDALLSFLEKNKATYTDWADDAVAFTINKQYFNPDAETFSTVINIGGSRRSFKALMPYMQLAHDMYLAPELGDEFYAELKQALTDDDMTDEQKALLPYLRKCEAYFTMSKAYQELRFVFKSNGIRVYETLNSIENMNTAKSISAKDAETYANSQLEYGKFYLKKLIAFLNKNADDYTTWKGSELYTDPAAERTDSMYQGNGILGLF